MCGGLRALVFRAVGWALDQWLQAICEWSDGRRTGIYTDQASPISRGDTSRTDPIGGASNRQTTISVRLH